MYSLIAIFALVPLYFSHVLAPFGVIIWETSSFERQKVYLFFFLSLLALVELAWTHGEEVWQRLKQHGWYLVGLLLFPLVSTLVWSTPLDFSFLFWSYEKRHGYLFFVWLTLLVFFLGVLRKKEKDLLVKVGLVSGVLVSFFALLEYIGAPLFYGGVSGTSWGTGRSISTLGNPNYLAGYLLLLLPLVSSIRKPERYILVTLFVMAILTTQSFIALFLLVLYGVSVILGMIRNPVKNKDSSQVTGFFHMQKWQVIRTFVVFVTGFTITILGYFLLPPDKLLSLTSRFVLMQETLSIMLQYPLSFFVGFGPDTIIRAYEDARTPLINAYFPSGSAIDSSHNIFIDFLFQFGIIPLSFIGYLLTRSWRVIAKSGKEGVILGIAFLSLNPYVLVHMILLVFLTSLHDRKGPPN